MRAEFLIVGGGLAGTTLALELIERGRTVLLIDDENECSSSRVAAGLINPIVPKGVRKTWMCDTIFPKIPAWFAKWEHKLNARFYTPMKLLQIHPDDRTAREWNKRSEESEYALYLLPGESPPSSEIRAPFGYSMVQGAGRLNVQAFLTAAKTFLNDKNAYGLQKLQYSDLQIDNKHVFWQGHVFKAVVFCEGIQSMHNPWFGKLHFHPTGGDVLRVKTHELNPTTNEIWKRKQWLVPDGEGNFLLGSNFHKGSTETKINPSDAELLLHETGKWFNGKLELLEHKRGVRPTVEGRRPYLGQHESGNPVFIFNGLGSKGSSLVTLLSPMMADYLCSGKLLNAEVDIKRFEQADN